MKANELRIGNYYYGDVLFPSEYNVITANDLVELDSDPLDDYYQPLPLTEEWLLKFGFEKRNKTDDGIIFGVLNFTLIFCQTMDNDFAYFLNGYHNDCNLQYVHELQNLYFALTKKELTMK
jgi:hypothetical protein